MPSLLLSGPPGAGKSRRARQVRASMSEPAVVFDFQEEYALLLGIDRDPETGRYPERQDRDRFALSLAEYIRRAAITGAIAREISVIATNSDGDPGRRADLLGFLGPGSREEILDPGISVVRERLAGPDGQLSDQCNSALNRWYGRL